MPRKHKELPAYEADIAEGVAIETGSVHYEEPRRHQHFVDPLAPLPGASLMEVPEQRHLRKQHRADAAANKRVYKQYLAELVASGGNAVVALSNTLGITLAEAAEKQYELHEKLMAHATSARAMTDVLKEVDLHKEARLQILRSHAYSQNPAASLKAIDMINELDTGRVADESSFEHYARMVIMKKHAQ